MAYKRMCTTFRHNECIVNENKLKTSIIRSHVSSILIKLCVVGFLYFEQRLVFSSS